MPRLLSMETGATANDLLPWWAWTIIGLMVVCFIAAVVVAVVKGGSEPPSRSHTRHTTDSTTYTAGLWGQDGSNDNSPGPSGGDC